MTRNNTNIGWRFPPTYGGREDGFKDSGLAHFSGLPLSSLARETIQNSLDARISEIDPVHVSFELIHVKPNHIGGYELMNAIDACIEAAEKYDDKNAKDELHKARDMLRQKKIPCLVVSDQNTTGLLDKNWHALIKMQGLSQKAGVEGAGGSYGIGKHAPFAVSVLRTVFYWTYYEKEMSDNLGSLGREYLQGKSILMSHRDVDNNTTQGTGFYGIKENCERIEDQDEILECFRMRDNHNGPICGTKLLIAGFSLSGNWYDQIASSVISNYFYAIAKGKLKVTIDLDANEDPDLVEINSSSIEKWFDRLLSDSYEEDDPVLERARSYWSLLEEGWEPIEKQDQDLGHCKLWIRVAEEDTLPSRVALIRGTGMLVTDMQRNLLRFNGFRNFTAVCLFEDPKGNELLRGMENPQHDKFEPQRLPEGEQIKGRRALKRITLWIRKEIQKKAGPSNTNESTNVSELANYLPDLHADESFDESDRSNADTKSRESSFGELVTVSLRPIRRPVPPIVLSSDSDDIPDGYGTDTGNAGGGGEDGEGGGGGRFGPGTGEGRGGSGTQGGGRGRKMFPISRIRILPAMKSDNRYRLIFWPEKSGTIRLELEEAGDSFLIRRNDVRLSATASGSLAEVKVVEGKRIELEITADEPIGDRAWRVSAIEVNGNEV